MPRTSTKLKVGSKCSILIRRAPLSTTQLLGTAPSHVDRIFGNVQRIESSSSGGRTRSLFHVLFSGWNGQEVTCQVAGSFLRYEGPATPSNSGERSETYALDPMDDTEVDQYDLSLLFGEEDAIVEEESEAVSQAVYLMLEGHLPTETHVEEEAPQTWTEVNVRTEMATSMYRRGSACLQLDLPSPCSVGDLFRAFIPSGFFITKLIPEINAEGAKEDNWTEINFETLMDYFAILILFSTCPRESRKRNWMEPGNEDVYTGHDGYAQVVCQQPNFSTIMSKRAFDRITKALTAIGERGEAALPLVLEMFRSFSEVMSSSLEPGRLLCVDETMTPWRGTKSKMPSKVKIPRKPDHLNTGREYRTAADVESGLMIHVEPAIAAISLAFDDTFPKTIAATLRMTEPWFGTGRTIIGDSWFGSPLNAVALMKHGLFCVLQVKRRKYWPKHFPRNPDIVELLDAKTSQYGDVVCMTRDLEDVSMMACAVKDRRVNVFVATCGSIAITKHVRRTVKEGRMSRDIEMPLTQVHDLYTQGRHSVDDHNKAQWGRGDSICKAFATNSWFVREVQMLVQIACGNAIRALRYFGPQSPNAFDLRWTSKRELRIRLALRLLHPPSVNNRRASLGPVDIQGHFLIRTPVSPSNPNRFRLRLCTVCKAARTSFQCGKRSCHNASLCDGGHCFAEHAQQL